ncbi:MAG: hypothetical protein LBE47_00250 [Methanomassiliicoccaceae archaeon]|nr:hypothetical protein [Methanomassiliicoccaceae archaeon]
MDIPCRIKNIKCPCVNTACPRYGKCCECVEFHRDEKGNLPFCLRKE